MGLHSLLHKVKEGFEDLKEDIENRIPGGEDHSHTHNDGPESHEPASQAGSGGNRYASFAPQSSGHAKWYVDGASYFWAVSVALEGVYIQGNPIRPVDLLTVFQRPGSPYTSWTGG